MERPNDMNAFNHENGQKLGTGFSVPDRYFDGIEDKIMARIASPGPKVVPLLVRYRKTIYAAAAILILSLMIPVYNLVRQPSENIDSAALEHYLAYESGINQLDLISAMDQSDIETIQEEYELPVSDDALEEEILYHDDIEHIITE